MSFWETVRGSRLADTLSEELPRLTDHLEKKPVFVSCDGRLISLNQIESLYIQPSGRNYALRVDCSGKVYDVEIGTEEECRERLDEILECVTVV